MTIIPGNSKIEKFLTILFMSEKSGAWFVRVFTGVTPFGGNAVCEMALARAPIINHPDYDNLHQPVHVQLRTCPDSGSLQE
ncbi:MAG: hypothetical protein ABFD50_00280 [Smithella sp.]